MRGKLLYIFIALLGFGITPADAGKTSIIKCFSGRSKDHPRGCGENALEKLYRLFDMGSPPRMRGKQPQNANAGNSLGITPADAGKTLKRSFRNQPFCS